MVIPCFAVKGYIKGRLNGNLVLTWWTISEIFIVWYLSMSEKFIVVRLNILEDFLLLLIIS